MQAERTARFSSQGLELGGRLVCSRKRKEASPARFESESGGEGAVGGNVREIMKD